MRPRARHGYPLAVFALLSACTARSVPTSESTDAAFGITTVVPDSLDRLCLSIRNPHLQVGQAIVVVSAWEPQSVMHARVIETRGDTCPVETYPDATEAAYTLEVFRGEVRDRQINIALVAGEAVPQVENGSVVVDLDGDGVVEVFRACTSMEGLHLSVESRPPQNGKRQWHRYVYLGYDLEPTCDQLESAGAEPLGA